MDDVLGVAGVHRHAQTDTNTMEVDDDVITNIVNDVASAIVEKIRTPIQLQKRPLYLPPPIKNHMYLDKS